MMGLGVVRALARTHDAPDVDVLRTVRYCHHG
jgi:hypothetical protein